MEVLIICVCIFALCFCLGVSLEIMALGIMIALVLMLLLTVGYFVCTIFELVGSKKCSACFAKIDKSDKYNYKVAYYNINGEVYPNAFPREIIFKDKIYNPVKTVSVRLTRNNEVYDINSLVTVAVGICAGSISAVCTIVYLLKIFYI